MRGEIYKCACGEVYFADPVSTNPCPECKKKHDFFAYARTPRYNVPIHQRTKFYACHVEKDSDDFRTLAGEVELKGGGAFELKNVSGKSWSIREKTDDKVRAQMPDAYTILRKGMSITVGHDNIEIV
jgi:hypothetical protein